MKTITRTNSNVKVNIDGLPSVCSVVGVILLVCKIFGVINWSWWWVLLPFWGPVALALVLLILAFIIAAFAIHDDD